MHHPLFPAIDIPPQIFAHGFHTRNVYGNDAAVRLTRDCDSFTLWVDHIDPEQREHGDLASRFELYQHDEEGCIVEGTNRSFEVLADILAYLETLA